MAEGDDLADSEELDEDYYQEEEEDQQQELQDAEIIVEDLEKANEYEDSQTKEESITKVIAQQDVQSKRSHKQSTAGFRSATKSKRAKNNLSHFDDFGDDEIDIYASEFDSPSEYYGSEEEEEAKRAEEELAAA